LIIRIKSNDIGHLLREVNSTVDTSTVKPRFKTTPKLRPLHY